MWIYTPAIIALLVKLALFYFSRGELLRSPITKTFLGLLCVMTVSNCLELLGYYYGSDDMTINTNFFLRLYYVALFVLAAFLFQISMLLANDNYDQKKYGIINYAIAGVLTYLVLFTDKIIAGAIGIGYTVTRVPGELYIAAPIYGISMLAIILLTCIYGYKTATGHIKRIQSIYMVISMVWLFIPIVFAILAMWMGYSVSAAVIFPVGISLFLITVTYALNTKRLYDIRAIIPGTTIFGLHMALHKEFLLNTDGKMMSAKERRELHEKRYLMQALINSGGNQTKAADMLKISPSSLSQKRKLYRV